MPPSRTTPPDLGAQIPPLPEPLVVWRCYEPAGHRVELTQEDLQHALVIGSTGSGKSTLLISAVRQLIRRPGKRIGLLVLDSKVDDLVERVAAMARQAGRERDVAVLGPGGDHSLDLFGRLRSYADVEGMTQRLLLATKPVTGDNPFWQSASASMLAAGLTLLVSNRKPVSFERAVEFLRRWFLGWEMPVGGTLPEAVAEVVEQARQRQSEGREPAQLHGALDQVDLWRHLDPRTRSNLQSCLLNVLRPLLSVEAASCFGAADLPRFAPGRIASEGKICLVSINALTQPELAQFIFRLARKEFFDAIQSRQGDRHRLCGLIADEFPLLVQPEDNDQLATLRSKRCFVLAATQGLSGLDERLGEKTRRAILLNFNTLVFLRTREEEAGELATLSLGLTQGSRRSRQASQGAFGWVTARARPLPEQSGPQWVCPPGALGRLQPHQGFVVQSDGTRSLQPLWFVPWFEEPQIELA